jgi:Domain of unknown function (DUF4403)
LTQPGVLSLLARMRSPLPVVLALSSFVASGCAGFGAVYPARPAETPGEAIADPTPSKVVMHTTITSAGLKAAIEDNLPQTGEGTFPLLGKDRKFTWKRTPAALHFNQGRIGLELHVDANADMPVSSLDIGLDFKILAEPVVTSEYVAKLQSLDVQVSSNDKLIKVADAVAGVLEKMKKEIQGKLEAFSFDLKPLIAPTFERVARPIDLPLGDAHGCALLKVLGVEAGPTVLADGFEKDLALVIAPSVTIPCAADEATATLPPLANVASLPSGPFSVTVPIAARYDELAKAMTLTFTDGKLFFSKDFPKLYMEKPEVYAAKDQLVLKLHIAGPIDKYGINTTLDGDIFMSGHPSVEDNELRVPDLEPTIETTSFLLKLKSALDGNSIRDQARAALHLDIGARLKAVKDKLSTDLGFGNGQGCVKAQANKIEVSGVHVHQAYLRVYVTVNAGASMYMPCP